MITFETLSEVFKKEKVKAFRVFDVGETFKTGLLMSGISEFIDFIKSVSIQRVFIYEHF